VRKLPVMCLKATTHYWVDLSKAPTEIAHMELGSPDSVDVFLADYGGDIWVNMMGMLRVCVERFQVPLMLGIQRIKCRLARIWH
jgi:hypothetical protein